MYSYKPILYTGMFFLEMLMLLLKQNLHFRHPVQKLVFYILYVTACLLMEFIAFFRLIYHKGSSCMPYYHKAIFLLQTKILKNTFHTALKILVPAPWLLNAIIIQEDPPDPPKSKNIQISLA